MHLDDSALRTTIAEILARHPASGVPSIRKALRQRYGFSCGTDRLRRILFSVRINARQPTASAETTSEPPPSTPLQVALQQALDQAAYWKERAERAEAREIVHQNRWATEIDTLRAQIHAQTGSGSGANAEQYLLLRKQHDFALRLIAQLRQELARFADPSRPGPESES